jgi:hypothetical protein
MPNGIETELKAARELLAAMQEREISLVVPKDGKLAPETGREISDLRDEIIWIEDIIARRSDA